MCGKSIPGRGNSQCRDLSTPHLPPPTSFPSTDSGHLEGEGWGGHVGKVVPSGICPPAGLVIFHFTWIQAYQALSSYSLVPLKVWRGAGRGKELPFTRSRLSPSLGSPLPQPDTYWTVRLRNSSTSPTSPNQALAYLIPPDPGNFTFKSLWSPSFDSSLQPQTRSQLSPLSTHFKLIVFNFKSDRASLERAFSVWPHSVNVLSSLSFRP